MFGALGIRYYQPIIIARAALDRHSALQEISVLISHPFIRFQRLINQTRAVMRASADPNMVEPLSLILWRSIPLPFHSLDRCGQLALQLISNEKQRIGSQSMAMPSQMSEGWPCAGNGPAS